MAYTKKNLIEDLNAYDAMNDIEEKHVSDTIAMLENTNDNCYVRSTFNPGHITGSAWLVSPDYKSVLMTHHAFLDRWLQFGGHADGEEDVKVVAFREAQEESGIEDIEFISTDIFDVDAHAIPENPKKGEAPHNHYDVRYLLKANTWDFNISDESNELKWLTLDEVKQMDWESSISRMIAKWERFLQSNRKVNTNTEDTRHC